MADWSIVDATAAAGAPPASLIRPVLRGYGLSSSEPPTGTVELLYLDSQGHIHELTARPGGPWTHTDLTEATGVPPMFGHSITGFFTHNWAPKQVGYVDPLGRVRELRQKDGAWTALDVTTAARADPAHPYLPIVGFEVLNPVVSKQYFYFDYSRSVHQMITAGGDAWTDVNLTAKLNLPYGYADVLIGFAWDSAEVYQIAYNGQPVEDIIEANNQFTGGWSVNDLTKLLNVPPIFLRMLSATAWDAMGAKLYVFVRQDFHVIELMTTWIGPWHVTDLTEASGAPVSMIRDITCFASGTGASKLVAYADTDGHVHQLRFDRGGTWTHTDLTSAIGPPKAFGPIAAYWPESTNFQQVAYLDWVGHVQVMTQGDWA